MEEIIEEFDIRDYIDQIMEEYPQGEPEPIMMSMEQVVYNYDPFKQMRDSIFGFSQPFKL